MLTSVQRRHSNLVLLEAHRFTVFNESFIQRRTVKSTGNAPDKSSVHCHIQVVVIENIFTGNTTFRFSVEFT